MPTLLNRSQKNNQDHNFHCYNPAHIETISLKREKHMDKILPFILLFLISACAPENVKPAKPAWINDPEQGAVGSSTTHVKGRHYQEDLAILRAREKLAARYGVEIGSDQVITERVVNDKSYVTSDKEIRQSINNKEVKAQVRATWHDTSQDEVWVWVFPVN